MSIFIALSLLYAFVGVLLIAFYTRTDSPIALRALVGHCFSHYKLYFLAIFVVSLCAFMWLDAFAHGILMLLLFLGLIDNTNQ